MPKMVIETKEVKKKTAASVAKLDATEAKKGKAIKEETVVKSVPKIKTTKATKTTKTVAKNDEEKKEKKTTAKKETKKATETKPKKETKKVVKEEKTTKKAEPKKTTKKETQKTTSKTTTKKATTKATTKTATKKTTTTRKRTVKAKELPKQFLQEYYDLPYRYNETIVTILAQTPKRLFVYWDVADSDREKYIKAFGEDFFYKTYPVLLVHNVDMDYTYEVPINDFANSWYLDIQDSKTNYVVQLGRKFKNKDEVKNADFNVVQNEHINLQNDFIYITDSNKLEAPNDHMLFETLLNQITYRNVKDGSEYTKNLRDLVKAHPGVKDLYKDLYAGEINAEEEARKNPASSVLGGNTSGMPSSSNFRI